jgi:integrase
MVRKRELIQATWDEVDLEHGVWTIPPERMKRREGHIVPLSTQALEAFKELKPLASGSRYVFPKIGRLDKPMAPSTLNVAFDRLKLDLEAVSHRLCRRPEDQIMEQSMCELGLVQINATVIEAAYRSRAQTGKEPR